MPVGAGLRDPVLVVLRRCSTYENTDPVSSYGGASASVRRPSTMVWWGVMVMVGDPFLSTATQMAVGSARGAMTAAGASVGARVGSAAAVAAAVAAGWAGAAG